MAASQFAHPLSATRARMTPSVRFIDTINLDGSLVKLYGAQGDAVLLSPQLTVATIALLRRELRTDGHRELSDGIGFATMHPTRNWVYVSFDCWFGETSLKHAAFQAAPAAPYDFRSLSTGDEVLPSWYLGLVEFERRAWQRHIISRLEQPDFERYLSEHYAADAV